MKPFVIMRSRNDMPLIAQTLEMVARQSMPCELVVLDNESTDGTAELARKFTSRVINIPAGTYVPGRVLNQGMGASEGELVAFLNSDCTPVDEFWLERLLGGFGPKTAAAFGRQMPRQDCQPLFAKDTEDTYGDGERQKYWKHCFSMASSAIRRSVWEHATFDEHIRYSEDIQWTWRMRQRGWEIQYVPDSKVYHSHNYTLAQWKRRQFGEGQADAVIFDWAPWERSFLRYSLLPYCRQVLADAKYCLKTGRLGCAFYSLALRWVQMTGRRKGFLAGWEERNR